MESIFQVPLYIRDYPTAGASESASATIKDRGREDFDAILEYVKGLFMERMNAKCDDTMRKINGSPLKQCNHQNY